MSWPTCPQLPDLSSHFFSKVPPPKGGIFFGLIPDSDRFLPMLKHPFQCVWVSCKKNRHGTREQRGRKAKGAFLVFSEKLFHPILCIWNKVHSITF
jgi:hypothetical protein